MILMLVPLCLYFGGCCTELGKEWIWMKWVGQGKVVAGSWPVTNMRLPALRLSCQTGEHNVAMGYRVVYVICTSFIFIYLSC